MNRERLGIMHLLLLLSFSQSLWADFLPQTLMTGASYRLPSATVLSASTAPASSNYKHSMEFVLFAPFNGVTQTTTGGPNYCQETDVLGPSFNANPPAGGPCNPPNETVTTSPGSNNTIIANPVSGQIKVEVPIGTFAESNDITISIPATVSQITPANFPNVAATNLALRPTGIGFEIIPSKNLNTFQEITITVNYKDAVISGFDESKLTLAYYENAEKRWITIPSTPDAENNRLTGRTKHLSLFQVMETTPLNNWSNALIYPNPFRPSQGHSVINFINLGPSDTKIEIFTIDGLLVWKGDVDSAGQASWSVRNREGEKAQSGVYLVFLRRLSNTKILKLAIQR